METYIINWDRDTTIPTFADSVADLYENTFVPKLNACANLSYVGMAKNGIRREAVFQIKNYTNLYIRICKDDRNDYYNQTGFPKIMLSKSADLTVCNNYYTYDGSTTITYGGSPTYYGTSNINMQFDIHMVKDNDNNLNCLWQFKAPGSALTYSQGIILGKTETNRDFIGIFGDGNNPIYVIYLDDANCKCYRIPTDTTMYNNTTKVLKKTWMPITTNNTVTTMVDNVDSTFVRIINSDLSSYEDNNISAKNSGSIRKLIQIGNTYYRQIVVNYWVEDPKGDLTPEEISNV